MIDLDGAEDRVSHWLDAQQRSLLNHLDTVLDAEAGLGDILTQAHRNAVTDRLKNALDTEAGLREILVPSSPLAASPQKQPGLNEVTPGAAAPEEQVSPQVRLTLRTESHVSEACGVLEDAVSIDKLICFVHTRAAVLKRANSHACPQKHTGTCGPSCVRLATDARKALSAALLIFKIAGPRSRAFAERLDLEPAGDRAATLAAGLESSRYRLRALTNITHSNGGCRNVPAAAVELTEILDEMREISRDVVGLCIARVWQTISMILGRYLPALDERATLAFLDDFTICDLRETDLGSIDLTGVRWSERGTLWPEAVDVEDLKIRSDEILAGSGVYVIRSGTATVRAYAETS
ncbi:hypothetical protein ACFRKD_08375 [Streptomyces niveus]|uniref:hypothetical protein n=1 Tax=Streptomyces niveus TaxID=193462 RepID=UPI003674C753